MMRAGVKPPPGPSTSSRWADGPRQADAWATTRDSARAGGAHRLEQLLALRDSAVHAAAQEGNCHAELVSAWQRWSRRWQVRLGHLCRNGLRVGEHQLVWFHAEPEHPAPQLEAEAALAQRGPERAARVDARQGLGHLLEVLLHRVQDLLGDVSGGLAHHHLHRLSICHWSIPPAQLQAAVSCTCSALQMAAALLSRSSE